MMLMEMISVFCQKKHETRKYTVWSKAECFQRYFKLP